MKSILIETARPYEVLIGSRLLSEAGRRIRPCVTGNTLVIVTDETVGALYAAPLQLSLERAGFRVFCFRFPAGEASKSLEVYGALLSFLTECGVTREDCIAALGGGVAGDLAGFAAATYLRGISYVQLPTSLLAMVDSSVGGKTAIDLPAGKNLCGAFWQPRLVLCDCDTLDTLPASHWKDGMGEVIKYAVLHRGAPLDIAPDFDRQDVICRCIEIKNLFMKDDEQDRGHRQLLNLGHTVGHAAETCSGYTLSHGCAVAAGLAIVTRAAAKSGLCPAEDAALILDALERHHLPTTLCFSAEALFAAMTQDKKRTEDSIGWIVPMGIGSCRRIRLSLEESRRFLEAGL